MHEVYFENIYHNENTLELSGEYFQGQITLSRRGIWRVFIWHRLEDKNKSSWIVKPCKQECFSLTQCGNVYQLNAPDIPSLEISLSPFSWQWSGVKGLALEAHSARLQSSNDMVDLATGEGNPYTETNDGLPIGNGLSLVLDEKEERHYYGLGERTGFLNKKGRIWENWTTDEFRHLPGSDPLYQAHPFFVGVEKNQAFAIYLDETWRSTFDLACTQKNRSFIHCDSPTFDFYLIPGPTPKKVIENYTALVGRSAMPPLWALGFHQCRWSYPNENCIEAVVDEYQQRDIPLEAIWLDIDYMEGYKVFTFSERFPNPEKLMQRLKHKGVRTVVIVDPGVKKEAGYEIYEAGRKLDAFVKNRRDEEFVGEVWPSPAVWPDFTSEKVRSWWGKLHWKYLNVGIDGIWNDMNEPAAFKLPGKTLPLGVKHGKYWHAEVHNLYGLLMSKATYEGLQKLAPTSRPFVLTRSGFSGIQNYAFVWTGDNASYWEHLEMSIPMLLNMGVSGVPFIGADIGGFSDNCNGEMLTRWTWLGAFYPFMRNHSGKGSRRQEPWCFGEPYTEYVANAIRFRYSLLPMLYTLCYEATKSGLPIMRPLFLEYPDDRETLAISDQFLFGESLLVAPAMRPQQKQRAVYFPKGEWLDYWTGKKYRGGEWQLVATPIDSIPLFQKCGTAIPIVSPDLQTSSALWKNLKWRLALAPNINGKVYKDEGDGDVNGCYQDLLATYQNNKLTIDPGDKGICYQIEIINVDNPEKINGELASTYYENRKLVLEVIRGEVEITWV